MNNIFTAENFTNSSWGTAKQKTKFVNHFIDFVENDMKFENFPNWFCESIKYSFGKMTYHNPEHYNRNGYYNLFFLCAKDKAQFFDNILHYDYSSSDDGRNDVVAVVRNWLIENKIYEKTIEQVKIEEYNKLKMDIEDSIYRLEWMKKEFQKNKAFIVEQLQGLNKEDKREILDKLWEVGRI